MKKFASIIAGTIAALSIAVLPANAEECKPASGEPDDILIGDVNGDGVVNSLDAAWILRYDAGLE